MCVSGDDGTDYSADDAGSIAASFFRVCNHCIQGEAVGHTKVDKRWMVTYACAVNTLWDKLNNEQTRGVGEGRSERKMMRNKEKGRGGGRNRKQNRTLSSRLVHFL